MRRLVICTSLLLFAPLFAASQETVSEGRKLIYDIFVMDASGDNAHRLTDGSSIVHDPSWSQNGRSIAFSRGTTQGLDIWVMSPDGQRLRAVTQLVGNEGSPSWSADGNTIAFSSIVDGLLSASIQAVSSDGGVPSSLTDTSPLVEPSFSPTGDRLLVTKLLDPEPRRYNFAVSLLENGTVIDIESYEVSSYLTQGSWSRNGDVIVCRANEIGMGNIGIINLSDTSYFQLTSHAAEDRDPVFSPNGQKVVFASDRTGDFDLYMINMDGTGLAPLTRTPDQDEVEPAFSPNGEHIAYTAIRLASKEEEEHAFQTALTLPKSLQAGRYLPDDKDRLSPWRLGLVWRTSHDSQILLLGANGELIGTNSNDIHPDGDVLYFVRDGDGAFLHHSGPLWRGYYARIRPDGSVVRVNPEQRPGAAAPPVADYDQWPYRDESDRIASVSENDILFPSPKDIDSGENQSSQPGIGWLIQLIDGSFYCPKQSLTPGAYAIFVERTTAKMTLSLRSRQETVLVATVESDGLMHFSKANTDFSSKALYWPIFNMEGEPVFPPEGFTVYPAKDSKHRFVIHPNGAIELPPVPF